MAGKPFGGARASTELLKIPLLPPILQQSKFSRVSRIGNNCTNRKISSSIRIYGIYRIKYNPKIQHDDFSDSFSWIENL